MICVRTHEAIPLLKKSGWLVESGETAVQLTHGKKIVAIGYADNGASLLPKQRVLDALDLIRLRLQ